MEIRWYYAVLRHSALLILLSFLIPGLLALVISFALPPVYQAQSDIVLYKSKANITLDPRFQTISEDELIRLSGQDPRRQTFSALAVSDQALTDTLATLPAEWRSKWTLEQLRDKVSVESVGNLLQLAARASSPQEAATIANLWAQTFAQLANQSFSPPLAVVDNLISQRDAAQGVYDTAEQVLVNFLAENQLDELSLQITIAEQAITDLQEAYQASAKASLMANVTLQQQLNLTTQQAEILRDALATFPEGEVVDSSTQVAILLLTAKAYNFIHALPEKIPFIKGEDIQFAIPSSTEAPLTNKQALSLLDQLTASLSNFTDQLAPAALEESYAVLNTPTLNETFSAAIRALQSELDRDKAALEEEQAKSKELTEERDLAWDNYRILAEKAAEVEIAYKTAETEVVIATQAIPPQKAVSPNKLLNTAIGAALGLTFGLAAAFVRAHLDNVEQ